MLGINQTIMMAISMVIITALVGVQGLGRDVWFSLREIKPGDGLESGIAIVLLAIVFDRISYALSQSTTTSSNSAPTNASLSEGALSERLRAFVARYPSQVLGAGVIALLLIVGLVLPFLKEFPDEITFSMAGPIDDVVDWMSINLHFITSGYGTACSENSDWHPLKRCLLWLPWPAMMILAAGLAYLTSGRGAALIAVIGLAFVGIGGVWT